MKKRGAPLAIQPANLMDSTIPLEFSLAWGVQNTDVVLKLKIDLALEEAKDEIAAILEDYGVPLVRCSACVVEGDLPSHGAFEEARAKVYEDRFTKPAHRTALSTAATPDQVVTRERLEAWLKEGIDVNSELMNAIAGGDNERVSFLIEKGAKVNERDGIGHLPLQSAASQRVSDIVGILIKAGAEVNARDSDGMTALLHAVNVNHVPSIELPGGGRRRPRSRHRERLHAARDRYGRRQVLRRQGPHRCRRQDRHCQRTGAADTADGDRDAIAAAEAPEPDIRRPHAAGDRSGAHQA